MRHTPQSRKRREDTCYGGEHQTEESGAVSTISETYRADRGYEVFDSTSLMFAVSSSRHKNALLARERFRMAATEQGRRHDHQNDG